MRQRLIERLIEEAELSPAQAEIAAEIMLDAAGEGALADDAESLTGGLGDLFGYGEEDDARPIG